MAFKASTATQAQGLQTAMMQAAIIKQRAQGYSVEFAAGNTNVNRIFQAMDDIRSALDVFNATAAIPGIGSYAQAQFNDPAYNVATEFTAMVNAVQGVVNWVVTNFPKDGSGFILGYKFNADGSRVPSTFTPAQTAGLRSALDSLAAAIS